jgi:UDP-glucuronate 4-epimerase
MRILVTGTAGFIGFHLARRLLADGHVVVGFDAMTPYYDVALKRDRHAVLGAMEGFSPVIGTLEDRDALRRAVGEEAPDLIVHLAAQAGVRHSLDDPQAYVSANLVGTFNLLELAREARPRHLMLASTSSVYGANAKTPFSETDATDTPLSFYAATKKAGEAMSHSYAHLWNLPTTCFRFFTVYGPWGRPDMALFRFVDAIARGRAIEVHGEGRMKRDFTYVDDLVEGIVRLSKAVPQVGCPVEAPGVADTLSPVAPWRVVNIGTNRPVELTDFIAAIEDRMGRTADKVLLPMQKGEVVATCADFALFEALTRYRSATRLEDGVAAFVDWYRERYHV